MTSTEDAVRDWMRSATPAPTGRVDVGTVMERARRRRRVRAIAIPSLAAVVVAAAITVVIVAAGPDRTGSRIAAPTSTSRVDPASCSKVPAEPDLGNLREGTAQKMVPPGAVFADVCRYAGSSEDFPDGQLVGSAHLDSGSTATLAEQLNRTDKFKPSKPFNPSMRVNCFIALHGVITITFTYDVGPPVTVSFFPKSCPTMTNGALGRGFDAELGMWIYDHTLSQGATAGPTVSP